MSTPDKTEKQPNEPPTDEELAEYERLHQIVLDARAAGEPDAKAEKELKDYMIQTGIANEAPVTDFPELLADEKP